MAQTRNAYVLVDGEPEPIDPFAAKDYGLGEDFYVTVFREIEESTTLSGYTFFLAYHVPDALPAYGPKVVFVVLADEAYQHRAWFSDVGCILRCLGVRPVYLDGAPSSGLRAAALVHFLYKYAQHLTSVARCVAATRRWTLGEVERKTLHVPLGVYGTFDPAPKPAAERDVDYAFLGSLGFDDRFKKLIHRLMSPPKILARRAMLRAVEALPKTLRGRLRATSDFWESVQTPEDYVRTMSRTKIALAPRGTSYETYRFFEACKAGCLVVCEPLPKTWCYERHPGIELADWSDLPAVVAACLSDPAFLAAKSQETLDYWREVACERAIAARVARFVEATAPNGAQPESRNGRVQGGMVGSGFSAAMKAPARRICHDV
ncbi:hypothetical protein [Methylocella sp.]|uniref:hypothetical protein n=1 Tax=Methylocella sp. TaxID=1978226 RepID=UPI003783F886